MSAEELAQRLAEWSNALNLGISELVYAFALTDEEREKMGVWAANMCTASESARRFQRQLGIMTDDA